jgi:hypothetical protein
MTGNECTVCITYLHDHWLLWWLYSLLLQGKPVNSTEEWLFSDTAEPAKSTQPLLRILFQKLEGTINNTDIQPKISIDEISLLWLF